MHGMRSIETSEQTILPIESVGAEIKARIEAGGKAKDRCTAAGIQLFKSKKRLALLPKGHRLYSSPATVLWMRGIRHVEFWEYEDQSGWPEMPKHYHNLDLDGEWKKWRYMSLTARWRLLQKIVRTFDDIVSGRVVPTGFPRLIGTPYVRENDCPPEGWRERAEAIWARLPANDSDIFVRPARTDSPRHAALADRLAPLLQWARVRVSREPLSSNFLLPDNDNYDEEDGSQPIATDPERRLRPGDSEDEARSWIKAYESGRLQISNGNQYESCYVKDGKKAVWGSIRMPCGAILDCPDRLGELLGSEPDEKEIARRRSYWTSLFSSARTFGSAEYRKQHLEPVRYIKAGRKRRKVKLTQAQQLEILATQPHPPVTYCKPGLPCGSENIADSFVGGWISATKGARPLERWEDLSDELSRQAEFRRWTNALPLEEQKALNVASTAANFMEIGEALGKTGKNAERYGKKALLASNDNLKKIIAA